MKTNSVKIKSAYLVTILTAFIFTFLFIYLGLNQRKSTYQDSKLIAREISRQAASATENYIISALHHTRSMVEQATILRRLGAHRDEVAAILLSTLKSNPNYLAVWTMWEPNAYDGRDHQYTNHALYDSLGHLSVTYFQWKDSVFSEDTQPYDYEEDYYTVPKQSVTEVIIEPYFYTYTGYPYEFFETSVVVPVIIDSVFTGVFAIDINLDSLRRNLSQTKLFDTGFLSLLSNNGMIVSHLQPDMVTKNFFDILSTDDTLSRRVIEKGIEYSLETLSEFTGKEVFRFFYPIRLGDSNKPWSIMVEIPVNEATTRSTQILYVAIVTLVLGLSLLIYLIINIYDRRRYEQTIEDTLLKLEDRNKALALSEQKFRDMAELMPQTIWETDFNGRVTFVNRNGAEVLGYSLEEIERGFDIMQAISPEDRQRALANTLLRFKGEPSRGEEYLALRKNGTTFPVKIYTSVILDQGKPKGLRGISIDMTETKRVEQELEMHRNNLEILVKERTEELEAANEELKSINEELFDQRAVLEKAIDDLQSAQNKLIQAEKMASLGILASGIAHEINNPLNYIYNGTLVVEEKIAELAPGAVPSLETFFVAIKEGTDRIANIVKSLNKFTKSEHYPLEKCDVHEALDDCLVMLHNHYFDRIDIKKQYNLQIPIVLANEGQIRQAFLSVLLNAIQAIKQTGTIEIKTESTLSKVNISIIDSGCGIEPENQNYIFDPFFSTKEQGKGTGLGLTLALSIIKEHKGTILCSSQIDRGTTFVITLPLYIENL